MSKLSIAIDAQIEELRKCGLVLPKAATGKNLLKIYGDDEFLDHESGEIAHDLTQSILYFLASESVFRDKDLPVGSRGDNFDFECIYGDGEYEDLVKRFAFLSGHESSISDLRDWVDVPRDDVRLRFSFRGKGQYFRPKVNRDWADEEVVEAVVRLFTKNGYQYYLIPLGQPGSIYFLKNTTARRICKIGSGVDLVPIQI
ncbi:MAG TPA: hypothetical protein DDZ51_22065 [Planctomycetaceae bacterium]|nr:hypothetical protein [Planctomycetaceae bacterium]